jgi:hypothetical protein
MEETNYLTAVTEENVLRSRVSQSPGRDLDPIPLGDCVGVSFSRPWRSITGEEWTLLWLGRCLLRSRFRTGRLVTESTLVTGFPPQRPGSGHVGFVVDKVTLGRVFSEYLGFLCQSSFHQLLHNHHHLPSGGWYKRPVVAAVSSALSLTPLTIIKK